MPLEEKKMQMKVTHKLAINSFHCVYFDFILTLIKIIYYYHGKENEIIILRNVHKKILSNKNACSVHNTLDLTNGYTRNALSFQSIVV